MATNQIKNLGANGVFSQKTPGDLTSLAKNPLVVPKIGGSIPLAMDLAGQTHQQYHLDHYHVIIFQK
jgi:hypothetical protein